MQNSKMSDAIITYEECERIISKLTQLKPLPTFLNIHRLEDELITTAKQIPARQSPLSGHVGMITKAIIYAMIESIPWTDPLDPVPTVFLLCLFTFFFCVQNATKETQIS